MAINGRSVLTVADISDYFRIHPSTVYRLLKRGQLPAFKVGNDWRFRVDDIARWQLQRSAPPSSR